MPYIPVHDRQLHYTRNNVTADRPSLVFVHGAGGSAADWPYRWRQSGTPLSRGEPRWITDYPRYFLDLPGHGRSEPPARTSIDAYAEDVIAFTQAAGIARALVVGHSMGGAIALAIGLMKPANLVGLAILGGGPAMPVSDAILDGLRAHFPQTVGMIMQFSWRKETRPIQRQVATQHMLAAGPAVVHGDFAACNRFDVRQRLAEIDTPALVIGAAGDRMMPLAQSKALAAGMPAAQLAVIEESGHFMVIERTNEVGAALLGFLRTATLFPKKDADFHDLN